MRNLKRSDQNASWSDIGGFSFARCSRNHWLEFMHSSSSWEAVARTLTCLKSCVQLRVVHVYVSSNVPRTYDVVRCIMIDFDTREPPKRAPLYYSTSHKLSQQTLRLPSIPQTSLTHLQKKLRFEKSKVENENFVKWWIGCGFWVSTFNCS